MTENQNPPGKLPAPAAPAFELLPRDLSAYRQGNVGIDYVHRFESGRPGPHVLINALTHGNEFCGMVAAAHLLDTGVRPLIGTLTVSFANVAAYETFDPAQPFESRQLLHNLNRIWSSEWLDGPEDSPELRRARELRPVVAEQWEGERLEGNIDRMRTFIERVDLDTWLKGQGRSLQG